MKAKRKDEHLKLYGHLSAWLISQMNIPGNNPDLLHWLIQQNSAIYRRTTTEALAYAMWLRRFAEAKGWGEEEKTLQEAKYEGTP